MDGEYDNLMAALNELQTGVVRLVLVTTVTLTPSTEADAEEGAMTAVYGGETFVLTSSKLADDTPATEEDGSGSSPSPSPQP
jgi:hypothetical protein